MSTRAATKAIVKAKKCRVEKYNESPKECICGKKLPYEKRNNKFCSNSCSASFNNKGVRRHGKERFCEICGIKILSKKYCSRECQDLFKWNKIVSLIESGGEIAKKESTARYRAKKYLIEKNGHKCSMCGNVKWLGQEIPLVCDHIDGDSNNNVISNFRLLCANCDRLQPTWGGGNKGNGREERRKKRKDKAGIVQW